MDEASSVVDKSLNEEEETNEKDSIKEDLITPINEEEEEEFNDPELELSEMEDQVPSPHPPPFFF